MKIKVKDWDLKSTGNEIELPDFIFNAPVRKDIVAQVVRWQLAKARSGNASTKTRSDVSGTTRKPWRQKETGKARQGSLRGPHFRGGGVVFGPHPRSYEYKLNKKIKELGMFSILSNRMTENCLTVIESFEIPFKKTKEFVEWKENNNLKKILFIGDISQDLYNCVNNVSYCDVLRSEGLNVLSCVKHDAIIFDIEGIYNVMSRYSYLSEDDVLLDDSNENVVEELAGEKS